MLPLPSPASEATAKPADTTPPGVSSTTSSRLAEEPKRNLDYLLEDEPHPAHGRMYLALALLLVAGVLVGWHWHREGYPWAERPAAGGTSSTSTPAPAPAASTPEAAASSAPASAGETHRPASKSPQAESGQPPQTQAAPQTSAAGSSGATAVPQPNPAEQAQSQEPASTGSDNPASTNAEGQQPTAASTTGPAEAASTNPASTAKPAQPEVKPPDVGTHADKLAAEGEKYLYGDGVPQNCGQAQRNLTRAARTSNAKAQGLLGTMYATGHCVPRDLPTAYRWFARALHQDPTNKRVQQDLEVLWRQMTPDERQAALRGQ
ncbi:MAG: hypothetical protein LAN63_05200 [Acidobacteriia bacterium]|nr:hypothetical protein [Terriglobia bacterium]